MGVKQIGTVWDCSEKSLGTVGRAHRSDAVVKLTKTCCT